jgi:MFS family permease
MPAQVRADEQPQGVQWLSIIAAIASITLVGIVYGLSTPLLSVILEKRGFSASMIGLNTAVAGVAAIAVAPIATPIAARLGVATTMILMVALAAISFVGFYFADAFWLWFPLRAVLNASITVLFILSEYWISTASPNNRRGLVLGLYATVLSLGFAFGPWLFSQIGSDGFLPFAVTCGIAALAAIPLLIAMRESPSLNNEGGSEGRSFLGYVWLVPTATAAVLVFGAAETGAFALFPIYGGRLGYSEADAAMLLSMIGLGNVVLQIPLGLISDRVRDRRILLLICALAGMAGTLLLPFVASYWSLAAVLLFIWGGFIAALYTIGLAHLGSQLSGRDLASANAAFVFCYGIGMTLGPQAIGIGMDAAGPSGFSGSLAIFFALYALLVGVRLVRRPRRA